MAHKLIFRAHIPLDSKKLNLGLIKQSKLVISLKPYLKAAFSRQDKRHTWIIYEIFQYTEVRAFFLHAVAGWKAHFSKGKGKNVRKKL